ncbi:MAG: hypothetical protein JXR76_10785 [Deltaproteobacteria bacterium]|nr:hypothetical protein [Deltaproteobacteria bacterium]
MLEQIIYLTVFLLCMAFWGCGESPSVDLFSITDVYPKIIEPGDVIVIEGDGFIEGKTQVSFEGTAKPLGLRPPKPLLATVPGMAVSENRIEIPVSARLMDTISKEAVQFRGVVNVSFPEVQIESVVSLNGKSPVQTLEFRPTGGGIKIHALKMREAQKIMSSLGLHLESGPSDDTIFVSGVVDGSYADHLEIPVGARLITVDSFPIMGLDELAGIELEQPHIFEFVLPEGISLKVQIHPERKVIKNDEFAAILLTSTVLGIFLAFILPVWVRKTRPETMLATHPLSLVLGYTVAAFVTVVFPAVVIQWEMNLCGTVILVAVFVVCSSVLLFFCKKAVSTRLSNALGGLFGISAIVLMGGTAGNTLGLYDAAASQSASLFGFHVWRNPVMMLTCILAISTLWPGRSEVKTSPVLLAAAWLQVISGAMITVFFCLGGWTLPGVSNVGTGNGIGMLLAALTIFGTKTWLVLLAARSLTGATKTERRNQATLSSVYQLRWVPLPLMAALAIYMELSTIPSEIQIAGQVISTGIFCTLFSLFLFSRILAVQKYKVSVG